MKGKLKMPTIVIDDDFYLDDQSFRQAIRDMKTPLLPVILENLEIQYGIFRDEKSLLRAFSKLEKIAKTCQQDEKNGSYNTCSLLDMPRNFYRYNKEVIIDYATPRFFHKNIQKELFRDYTEIYGGELIDLISENPRWIKYILTLVLRSCVLSFYEHLIRSYLVEIPEEERK